MELSICGREKIQIAAVSRSDRKGGKATGGAQQQLLMDTCVCQKCFCITFGESNKACPVSGAYKTDKRRDAYWREQSAE